MQLRQYHIGCWKLAKNPVQNVVSVYIKGFPGVQITDVVVLSLTYFFMGRVGCGKAGSAREG